MENSASVAKPPRTRAESPFSWAVQCVMPVYAALAGVRYDRTFTELDAIIEAYSVGRPRAEALYGPDVRYAGPGWSGISYGHINGLGAPLVFPLDSEVAHRPIYRSLDEGIAALQRPTDWASAGMMPCYLELWRKLQRAFPGEVGGFPGYGVEGPITTAWELRGHGFFEDVAADPERCKEYLRLVTESIIEYRGFVQSVNKAPLFDDRTLGLADDVAAMISPRMWPEMVLPYLERFYAAQTSGWRNAHIEDLTPGHLHFLDELRISSFDVSVSPRLQPADVRDRCGVPFVWRLNEMQARDMDTAQMRRFAVNAVADGASGLTCTLYRAMTDQEMATKVKAFIDDCKRIAALLADGCPRGGLRDALR
ncbi:MAG: hypothetical protein GX557_06395 [Chloroflexi bacterium]|nr:hypothetical protein [Chloroflexota bacterium]